MAQRLSQSSQALLLQTPLLTPTVIGLEQPEETALAIRTANLFPFRQPGLPILIRPISYQGKEGIWLAILAFRIKDSHKKFFEGAGYLNPRNAEDWRLLQHLIKQERLPILFLSPRLRIVISHAAEWTAPQRQELRLLLTQAPRVRTSGAVFGEGMDPDFERVKREFAQIYSIQNLLMLQPGGIIRPASPFRGAVLD